jgi:hypothetical protein
MTQIVNHAAARAQAAQAAQGTSTGAGGSTGASSTAVDVIKAYLDDLQLGSLAGWAWDKVLAGEQWPQIYQELKQTNEYKAKYPAMETLAKQGRAITEQSYNDYSNTVRSLSQQYGVPTEMYATPDGIAKMLINGVSASEANQRFQLASIGAISAPEDVKRAYKDLYGLSGGDLIATYLDPEKSLPILQRQAAASQVAGAAYREGLSTTVSEAERLADQGVTYDQAVRGYGQAQIYEGLDYAGGMSTTRDERVAAQFGDQAAATKVQQAVAARQAAFQGGGGFIGASGYTQSAAGITGLGRNSA